MRFTGLNRIVEASIHSLQLRGALTSTSSVLSCASSLSVRHSNVSHCTWCMVLAAPPVTKCAKYLTAWWSITKSGAPSGACKRMREWKSAMISGTSSVGKPCNLSEGGRSDFFIEKIPCSLWWCELGGATAEVVRAVGSASTAEAVRAVRGAG